MTEADHAAYFRQRAAAERDLAKSAPEGYIARIHARMAERYDELADDPGSRDELKVVRESSGVSWNGC